MEPTLVGLGGALGAICRYAIGQLLRSRSFPYPTLVVNVLGSFILGLMLFGVSNSQLLLLVGVGFCGAFTTFSSFSYQTVGLWEEGRRMAAVANAVGNLLLSLLAFGLAWFLVG